MVTKYERYTTRFKRRLAELPYREVRRANLDRIGKKVLQCMSMAGDTAPTEKWERIFRQIDTAHSENPEYAVVVLWRLLCNFSVK